jgi:hypothetical protein
MSEEAQVVVGTAIEGEALPNTEVTQVEDNTQYSDIERQALEQGWRPKSEWEGDPEDWRSAKEFVGRGELYGKLDTMGRELKDTKKALRMLQEHHTKVKETEYKKAVDELKALQKQHLEAGNSEGYIEATDILTDLKAEQKAREVVRENTPNAPDPRFIQWAAANKWYEQDPGMRRYADMIGQGYAQQNPDLDPVEVLKFVTSEVRSKYKDKFVNPNRSKPSSVEGGRQAAPAVKTALELTDDERKVMNTFIRQNVMTKEEYMDQVKAMRGIKQ